MSVVRSVGLAIVLLVASVSSAMVLSVANDCMLGQRRWMPSAWRRMQAWEAAANERLAALEAQYGWTDRLVPWTTDFDREQERIRAESGMQHSKWTSPVAHLDEFMRTYARAASIDGLVWGGGVGAVAACVLAVRRARSATAAASGRDL